MFSNLKNLFITGALVSMPLGITFLCIKFLIDNVGYPASALFFGSFVGTLNKGWITLSISLLSIAIVVAIVILIGYASKLFFGKMLLALTDRVITAIPFLNSIYKTVKQIVDALGKSKEAVFQKAVLVPFPSDTLYSIGFLTNKASGETQVKTKEIVYNVFVPTTPNPTSGFLIMVPESKIVNLDMSIGDAIKLIISGGSVSPEDKTNDKLKKY